MTLRYVLGSNPEVGRAIARMIPHCDAAGFPTAVATIGVVDNTGRMVAGLVYYNHNRAAGTLDIAAAALAKTTWLTRPTIRLAFETAFRRFGCQMVVMRVRADDPLWKRLADFGFELTHVRRMFGRETGGIVCTLTDDAWAKNRFNRSAERHKEAA